MRWLILTGLVLVVATVLGLASSSTSGQAGDLLLQDRTVCIDAGHGGDVKNLYNLYVYFWRWALWKVFENGTGGGPGAQTRASLM